MNKAKEPFERRKEAVPSILRGMLYINKVSSVVPQFLKDAEAFEFRELGDVELIVVKQDVEDAVAIRVVEAIEMHGGEVHAHQGMDATRVIGLQEITMCGG